MNPATARYLDGPKLVDWLRRLRILEEDLRVQVGDRWEVRIRRWADGSAASVFIADELLCSLGVCLGEVPDDFYREPPRRGAGDFTPIGGRKINRILDLRKDGLSFAEIGRRVGCDSKTAKAHVLKAGLA